MGTQENPVLLIPRDTMILSKYFYRTRGYKNNEKNDNVLVVGNAGSGKTYSFVKPNLLQTNCSYIINDLLGHLAENYAAYFLANGYKVRIFDINKYSREDIKKIKFSNAGKKKTAIFIIDSKSRLTKGFSMEELYAYAMDTLTKRKNKIHVCFMLDDFMLIGEIPGFKEKLERMNKANASCVAVVQSLDKMNEAYREYTTSRGNELISCFDTKVYFGCSDSYEFNGDTNIFAMQHSFIGRKTEKYNSGPIIIKEEHGTTIDRSFPLREHPGYLRTGEANKEYKFNIINHSIIAESER